ncbi:MAG: ACP S-malonyltransferase [Armatimonadetes bacterium]|nr:ACP S-malonyltransferase [Armatimonadota bacterium]
MKKTAFLFPGQGSQKVGMGSRLSGLYPEIARDVFLRADGILEYPISRLCFEGPEEALTQTENAQPGIFLASMAALHVLKTRGLAPQAVAGHSLGEYSALVAAGALTFETALRLVRKRGLLMAEAAKQSQGTAMAAIMGIPAEKVEEICASSRCLGCVEIANLNSPQQTVISGERKAVEQASAEARRIGGKAIPLKVSAPFHCSLMNRIRDSFASELNAAEIRAPEIPVVANVTGDYVRDASSVRNALKEQVAGAVRWYPTIERLVADEFTCFVEVGPGKVLTGLMRQIAPGVEAHVTDDRLDTVIEDLCGVARF